MGATKRAAALTAAILLANAAVLPAASFAASDSAVAVDSAAAASSAGTSANTAQGKLVMSKEKAEALARQLVQIPEDYSLRNASYTTELLAGGKRAVWSLDFTEETNGKTKATLSVRVNADKGTLISFDSWENDASAKPSYPLKVEREAAKEIALDYIEEMAPDYAAQVAYNEDYGVQLSPPLTGEVRHSLYFDRVVNGIPYMDNGISVDVDSEGHVVSYSLNWDETIVFPKAEAAFTVEEATDKLAAVEKPELSYVLPYDSAEQATPILGYTMDSAVIDAQTGEQVKQRYSNLLTTSEEPVAASKLGEKTAVSGLTAEQAEQTVQKLFPFPDGTKLTDSSYNEYKDSFTGRNRSFWNLSWTVQEEGKDVASISATVDGSTGEVQSYYSYTFDSSVEEKPKVSYEKAKTLAAEAVKKLLPWAANELYLVSNSRYEDQGRISDSYYISFTHKVNGAAVSYDGVSVAIDAQTGEVRSFDANLADLDYGSGLPKVLSESEASAKWHTYYKTVLTYYLVNQYWVDGKIITPEQYNLMVAAGEWNGDRAEQKSEVKLVYRLVAPPLDETVFLGAESGEWLSSSTGEPTQLEKPQATDIEGHWAENELALMVAYKALDLKDGKVRPNETITRGELIKMLVLAMNSGSVPYATDASESGMAKASFNDVGADSRYYKYVESALDQDLIDVGDGSFNPDGKVNREEMAELIVRALGYNPLANYDDLFNITFSDSASVEQKGQAAIVVGLGIMSLDEGKFEADRPVTRADAAAAFFRYLQVRADLKEAPLRD